MTEAPATLRIVLGDYPHTAPLKRGEVTSPWLKLEFIPFKPLYPAFRKMVREHAFDASEMALVSYFQAKAHNKGLTLLPAAMLSRFQHGAMLYNAERGKLALSDLPGKRIGVRSYSQTTGVWLRGIIENDYGVDLNRAQWVTFEDGHVAEAKDPPEVIRARADQDLTHMLIAGELDAAIYGAALPDDPRLQSVIPDPDAAAREWYARHRLVPVNHMVVVTEALAREKPHAVAELYRLLEAGKRAAGSAAPVDTAPFGKEANRPCLELLLGYARQQKLVPNSLTVDALW